MCRKENKQWMKMGIMALNALASACTDKENVSVPARAFMTNADNASSSTATIDSDCDFEEHKCCHHQKRFEKKCRVKWKATSSERKNRVARKAILDLKEEDFVERLFTDLFERAVQSTPVC